MLKIEYSAKLIPSIGDARNIISSFNLKEKNIETICPLLIDEIGSIDVGYIDDIIENGDEEGIFWQILHSLEVHEIIEKSIRPKVSKMMGPRMEWKNFYQQGEFCTLDWKKIYYKNNIVSSFKIPVVKNEIKAKLYFRSLKLNADDACVVLDNYQLSQLILFDIWSIDERLRMMDKIDLELELSEMLHGRLCEILITEMGYQYLTHRAHFRPKRIEIFTESEGTLYSYGDS